MASTTPVSWKEADEELLRKLKAKAKELHMGWSAFVVSSLRTWFEGTANEAPSAAILAELREIKQMLKNGAVVQQVQDQVATGSEDDDEMRDLALSRLGI